MRRRDVRPSGLGLVLMIGALVLLRTDGPLPPSTPSLPVPDVDARLLPPAAVPLTADQRAQERAEWEALRLRDPRTGRVPSGIHLREQEMAARQPRREPGYGLGGAPLRDKDTPWSVRGPRNYGGRTRALAFDVSDPTGRTLLAGGVSGGMWRSTDGGASWTLTTGSSQLHCVTCVQQDIRPGHEAVWWYGTGEVIGGSAGLGGDAYYGDGIYRSVDGGLTWTVLPSTATDMPQAADQPFDGVTSLALDATNLEQPELYAATRGGIYRSVDGGVSWTGVLGRTGTRSLYAEVAVGPAGTVYATLGSDGTTHGVFRSEDGLEWRTISPAGLDGRHGRIAIGASPSLPGLVYFLTSDREDKNRHQLWFHYHGPDGDFWFDRSAALDELPDPWGEIGKPYSLNTQRGYNLHVTVSPESPGTVYVGGVHLWRSRESFASGRTVQRVGGYYYPADDEHHADQHRLVFMPGSPRVALTASDGGVHRTGDIEARAVAWESLNHGYDTTQFYTVALDPAAPGNPVVVGGAQDHGTLWTGSVHDGDPWRLVLGGDGSHCAVIDAVQGQYVLSTYYGWTFRLQIAADGEVEHLLQINPTLLEDRDCLFINPFVVPPGNRDVIYMASRRGVWRNMEHMNRPWSPATDRDTGWEPLTDGPAGDYISALATGPGVEHDLYFGTAAGEVYRVADAASGGLREPERLGLDARLPQGAMVSAIAVHPQDQERVLLAYGNYNVPSLWYSADGGATWRDVENNLAGPDGPSVRAVAFVTDGGRDLWLCGTSVGLFSALGAADGRTEWVQEGPETLGNVIVDAVAVRHSDQVVVAATHGRGIFSAAVTSAWWDDRPLPEAPTVRAVRSAPNPFNARTSIVYEVTADAHVRLEVLDIRGRRLATLVDAVRARGEHAEPWDGRDARGADLGSGVYLYRLTALGTVRDGKMVLVR